MDPVSPKPRKPRRIKWLILSAVAVLLIAAVICFFVLDAASRRIPAQIQAKIAALKQAGQPVTAEDLDKMYPALPDDQNSALIYQKATNFSPLPLDHTNWPIVGASIVLFRSQSLAPAMKQSIANYISQNQRTLDSLHQATTIEKGYYDLGLKDDFPMSVRPPLAAIRYQAQTLALTALLRAEENQPALVTQDILDLLGPPRSLERDPRLMSQTIRAAILGLSSYTLEFALNHTAFTEDQLESLAVALHKAETVDGLKEALIEERCQCIRLGQMFIMDPRAEDSTFTERIKDIYYRIRYYRKGDFIFYLDFMARFIAATDLPYPERLATARQLSSKVEGSGFDHRAFGIFLRPSLKTFQNFAEACAHLRLAQTALAVERFRLANQNQLPPALQNLTPTFLESVPIDPFDGRPLRYKKLPQGYIIYSVGPDGVDDGGIGEPPYAVPSPTNAPPYDLIFKVER